MIGSKPCLRPRNFHDQFRIRPCRYTNHIHVMSITQEPMMRTDRRVNHVIARPQGCAPASTRRPMSRNPAVRPDH